MKRLLAALIIAATCAAPGTGIAQQCDRFGHGGEPLPMPLMMALKQANLTPEQQTKVHEIMAANFTQARPLIHQLRTIHDQIADKLLSTKPVTATDIAPLQEQENRIHQQLDQQLLSAALQIRGLLNADQLSRVAALHTKLEALREQIHALVGEDASASGPPPGL